MQHYYLIEGLFILLGLALLWVIIKYPKDVLIKLPLGILKAPFYRIRWLLTLPFALLVFPLIYFGAKYNWKITPTLIKVFEISTRDEDDEDDDDKPYPSTKKLKVDFGDGNKYFYVISSNKDPKPLIDDFLEALTGKHTSEEFSFSVNGEKQIIQFPKKINFYDFHLLVQHLNGETGEEKGFGVFKSENLHYSVFQDPKTQNNLIGFTNDKRYFSLYMLDGFENNECLRLNQKLKVETDWVERALVAG